MMPRQSAAWSVLLLAWCLLATSVTAQRQAVSLAAKLKKKLHLTPLEDHEFIVQGENVVEELEVVERASNSLLPMVAITTILLVWRQLFAKSTEKKDDGDSDDVVVKDGHVEALGGLHDVDLGFEDIKLVLKTKKGSRVILDGSIRGHAKPGRMLAIMGPSGAGKSSCIHALAGRIKDSNKLSLSGRRYINGARVSGDSMIPAAFIEQSVNFFPHMTVKETLDFRVELKVGSQLSKSERDKMVADLMAQLGLTEVAHTIVGSSKIRGISGGERKRLSIAVEMISSPSVIFLDEPTSGLDSSAATSLVETLRELANAGKTIVAVIHQPSQHVFAQFDDLLLLARGKQMYYGEIRDVRAYMENYGCEAEPEMGTAEHIIDCISTYHMDGESAQDIIDRVQRLADRARSQEVKVIKSGAKETRYTRHAGGPKAGVITQFRLLFKRAFAEVFRGKGTIILKLVQQVTMGLVYGGIYHLSLNQASIQDRFGLLSLLAIGAGNMALANAVRAFPKEKAIVANEIASKMYATFPYFIGKAVSEVPLVVALNSIFGAIVYKLTGLNKGPGKFPTFLGVLSLHSLASEAAGLLIGAISPSSDVALALFPAFMILNIIFDGKNISEENTPKLLRWIPKVGLVRWGFEGLCVNEFEGLEFETGGPRRGPVAKTGSDALARLGLTGKSVSDVFKAQLVIVGSCWMLSYVGLALTGQRFLEMKEPKNSTGEKSKEKTS